MESAKRPIVAPMVTQRKRMARPRLQAKKPPMRLGFFSSWLFMVLGSSMTPMSGANSTATTQEISKAAAMT